MKTFCLALMGLSLLLGATHAAELTSNAWMCKTPEGHDWLMQQSLQDRGSEDFKPQAKEKGCAPAPAEPQRIAVLDQQAGKVHVEITYERQRYQGMTKIMEPVTMTGWTSEDSVKSP